MKILRRKRIAVASSVFLIATLLLVGLAKSMEFGVFAQNSYGSYQLFFDLNGWQWGGSVPTMDCGDIGPSSGCDVTLPSGPTSTNQDSYVFAGWADSADATEAQYSTGETFHIPRQDTTLYAVYEKGILNYQAYNGNTTKSTCYKTVKTSVCQVQLKTYDELIAEGMPARVGYTFLGWADTSSATSAQYQPGAQYTVAPGGTNLLYGVWEVTSNTFTLSFDANASGDTVSNMPQTQTGTSTNTTYEFTVPTTVPTRQGYTFLAWVENIHSSEGIQPGSKITVGNSSGTVFTKTLYAVWKGEDVSYTVNYNANGGVYTGVDPYIEPTVTGCTTDTGKCNVQLSTYYPYRDGYTFQGWADSASAIVPEHQPNDLISLVGNSTIYAVWKENAVNHEIVDGGDGIKYALDSGEPLVIKVKGDLSEFSELKIDGVVVPSDKYTKTSEGELVVITIDPNFLKTLPVGEHSITLAWTDGETTAKFTVAETSGNDVEVPNTSAGTPETGTNTGNNIGGGIAVVALPIMLAGLATFAYRRNINKAHRKFDQSTCMTQLKPALSGWFQDDNLAPRRARLAHSSASSLYLVPT